MSERKVVQRIKSADGFDVLCDDGTVWRWNGTEWKQVHNGWYPDKPLPTFVPPIGVRP